jgi:hypothetical protein
MWIPTLRQWLDKIPNEKPRGVALQIGIMGRRIYVPLSLNAGMLISERTANFRVNPAVRPASLYEAAIFFASTSLLFFACLYLLLPLLRLHQISWFATYNLVLAAPMFMLVGCAFLAYHLEGRQLRWPDVRDRFRLRRMGLDTWLWTAALAIFMFGGRYASLAAFILVLLALGLDRSAGLKRRVKMAFGVAAFLALSWVIWQAQPILGRIAHSVANSGFLIQIVQGIVRS